MSDRARSPASIKMDGPPAREEIPFGLIWIVSVHGLCEAPCARCDQFRNASVLVFARRRNRDAAADAHCYADI
jgi:hypothetical protein